MSSDIALHKAGLHWESFPRTKKAKTVLEYSSTILTATITVLGSLVLVVGLLKPWAEWH
jgi:hypothetical protein